MLSASRWLSLAALVSLLASARAQAPFENGDPHGIGILLKRHFRDANSSTIRPAGARTDSDGAQTALEIPMTNLPPETTSRSETTSRVVPPKFSVMPVVQTSPKGDAAPASQGRDDNYPLPAPKSVAATCLAEQTISGFPLALPPVPQRGPFPPADVGGFVENLGNNDASFEVVFGQGRLLTLRENLAAAGKPKPVIAVGDPSILDFVVVGPRQIRVIGQRIGATDLSITTAEGRTYSFDVQVVADLGVLRVQLKSMFPDASLKLTQVRDSVVVEGEARDTVQVAHIIEAIKAYLMAVQVSQARKISGQSNGRTPGQAQRPGSGAPTAAVPPTGAFPGAPNGPGSPGLPSGPPGADAYAEPNQLTVSGTIAEPRVINLIRVPGPQQVLLKVRIGELDRTALRQIGADWLAVDPSSGAIVGTQIGGAGIGATATLSHGLSALVTGTLGSTNTVFGIFQKGDFAFFLTALRQNNILKILAEPNLVAMNGEQASFLAGGEFPVPVPQVGASGVAPTVTVQFKEFGVRLGFVPFILDGDVIRLTVDPEVSSIDSTLATTLVSGGSPVPGINSRKAHTTVELRHGQTLMIAGLLQLNLDGQTSRIPGLGDLPIIGPFFSNTTHKRQEKELVVMVTPYLVEPMNCDQVPPYPGEEVSTPTDLELYFLNRIEGRTGRDFRSTTEYDDPWHLLHHVKLEKKYISGPCGFSE
jgi:pilus assembly protein CpaC